MPLIRKGAAAPPDPTGAVAEQVLKTGTTDERWTAARTLSGEAKATKLLGDALNEEKDPQVREAILTSLARIGTAESAAVIAPLLRSDDAGLRTSALDALRVMPAALESGLGALVTDADPDVRVLACDLARQLPAALATRLLCGVLEREVEPNVCAAAIDVLAECGGPDALAPLAACAERFAGVPFLVFASRIARERIRDQTPRADG